MWATDEILPWAYICGNVTPRTSLVRPGFFCRDSLVRPGFFFYRDDLVRPATLFIPTSSAVTASKLVVNTLYRPSFLFLQLSWDWYHQSERKVDVDNRLASENNESILDYELFVSVLFKIVLLNLAVKVALPLAASNAIPSNSPGALKVLVCRA
jgi:hypothetical protein